MISLENGELIDILPSTMKSDIEVQCISRGLKEGMDLLFKYLPGISVYSDIDNLSDDALNMLAVDLRTQYYDESLDIETKRLLIKNTLGWYMIAGTPATVEELVSVVFGEGKVVEWFEYGGEPYTFKIVTNATYTEEINELFTKMIRLVKSARSKLDTIEISRTTNQYEGVGIGVRVRCKQAAISERKLDRSNVINANENIGVGQFVSNCIAQPILINEEE